jgi:hypothetical protein
MGALGAQPDVSAKNAVRLLTQNSVQDANGAVLRAPKRYYPERLAEDPAQAAKLWEITRKIAESNGLTLP